MLWTLLLLLLAAAVSVESYGSRDSHERLTHGRQLKIYLPKSSEQLEFVPADRPDRPVVYWGRGSSRTVRGKVQGSGTDRRWILDRVTYEDQGTYVQRDYWDKEVSTVRVKVTPRYNSLKCVAGESLSVSLEGMELQDATLVFSSGGSNVTLVRDGARVSQDIPDYWNRVQTFSMKIQIQNVNYSDEGHYTLWDRRDRVVSVTRMDLTDRHDPVGGNPLLALLLLLGIPAGICCCCRKKIFKKKNTAGQLPMSAPDAVHPPPGAPVGPGGPCPPYAPGQPGTVYYPGSPAPGLGPVQPPPAGPQWNGLPPSVQPPPAGPQWNGPPPSPGFNPSYPPANTSYSPAAPMIPPGQPPQWSGPPQGPYPPPGPAAPVGYYPAPVMYSSAPPEVNNQTAEEEVKTAAPAEAEGVSSAVAPGAPPTPVAPGAPPPAGAVNPSSDGDAFQFQIDGGKSSSNFL